MRSKRSAWIQMDVDSWELMTELLPDIWPEWAVFQDLRYWQNGEKMGWFKRPSRRGLQSRWGWTDWSTRQAMKSENKWGTSQLPPNSLPTPSQDQPRNSTQLPEIRKPTNPTPSSDQPKTNPTPSPRAELKNKELRTKNKEVNKTLLLVWTEINRIKGGRSLKLTKSRASALEARIKESSSDDVLAVVKWRETSTHKRAAILREGGYGIDTLLREKKFQMYLEMSHELSTVKPKTGKGSLEGNLMDHFFANIGSEIIDVTPTKQRIE
tara:strand:+ start:6168 stop:6968 length:801 start_codon:yes stop_codon:yes gene_type:complete